MWQKEERSRRLVASLVARAGPALAPALSHLCVSNRSLLSGSFRFLKKQSEGEFSAGTSVKAGPGRCHRWVGGTQAQKATCPSLAGHEAQWPAAPHAGSLTVPLQQGAQHGGGGCPSPHGDPCQQGGAREEGVDVRALMERTAHSQHSGEGVPALGPQGWVSELWSS